MLFYFRNSIWLFCFRAKSLFQLFRNPILHLSEQIITLKGDSGETLSILSQNLSSWKHDITLFCVTSYLFERFWSQIKCFLSWSSDQCVAGKKACKYKFSLLIICWSLCCREKSWYQLFQNPTQTTQLRQISSSHWLEASKVTKSVER